MAAVESHNRSVGDGDKFETVFDQEKMPFAEPPTESTAYPVAADFKPTEAKVVKVILKCCKSISSDSGEPAHVALDELEIN